MKNFLLIVFAVCAIMISSCKREKSVAEPSVSPVEKITKVSGNQSGVWSGKIRVIGDVVVPDGETLTIEAGTSVVADGYYGITVLGNLNANGRENARISFTVADTTGYSNYDEHELGSWKGFFFHKSGNVALRYCDFSYGKTQYGVDGGVMRVFLTNADSTIAQLAEEVAHCMLKTLF